MHSNETGKIDLARKIQHLLRPIPPKHLVDRLFSTAFEPAPALESWVKTTFIEPGGMLHNEDHFHLLGADIRFLWASTGFEKAGRSIIGQAEDIGMSLRGNSWQKVRGQYQMEQWFDAVPAFLITLDGHYCSQCSDAELCALVEHELYHIRQKQGPNGPVFDDEGKPSLCLQGHDVEEFVGVVRRYGPGSEGSALRALVLAAAKRPEVAHVDIARACGTCLLRSA